MRTNFPTKTFYFVFAFTYCRLRVYREQAKFAERILKAHDVEFLHKRDSKSWEDIDTRILLDLVEQVTLTIGA